jgi:transposase
VSTQFVYSVRDRLVLDNQRSSHRVGGYRQSVIGDMQSTISGWIKAEPGLTLQEMCDRLAAQGRVLKVPALWHQLNKWKLSFKKNPARQRARARRRAAGAA